MALYTDRRKAHDSIAGGVTESIAGGVTEVDYTQLLQSIIKEEFSSFINNTKEIISLGYISSEEMYININFDIIEKEIKALQSSCKLNDSSDAGDRHKECIELLDNLSKELEKGRKIKITEENPFAPYNVLALLEHSVFDIAKRLNEL